MHNKNYTKRYSKEAEDIDEIFLFDSKKSQKKSSIHKNDSDKNLVSLEKSGNFLFIF